MFCYTAYGLHIHSSLKIPELIVAESRQADVTIRRGRLGYPIPLEEGPTACIHATPHEIALSWGRTATLLLREGHEIIIDAFPGVEERVLRLFILGAGLGVLLHQRHILVLHASAVAVEGRVVAFLGEKGWGKSTTAAALSARGHQLMTDDLVAITFDDSGYPFVLPGYPEMKLWPDAVEALGGDPEALPQIRSGLTKRSQAMRENFPQSPQPLAAVYLLGKGERVEINALPSALTLMQLIRHVYTSYFGTAFAQSTQNQAYFLQCTDLAKRIPIRLLRRPFDLSALDKIAEAVEADVLQTSPVDVDRSGSSISNTITPFN